MKTPTQIKDHLMDLYAADKNRVLDKKTSHAEKVNLLTVVCFIEDLIEWIDEDNKP